MEWTIVGEEIRPTAAEAVAALGLEPEQKARVDLEPWYCIGRPAQVKATLWMRVSVLLDPTIRPTAVIHIPAVRSH